MTETRYYEVKNPARCPHRLVEGCKFGIQCTNDREFPEKCPLTITFGVKGYSNPERRPVIVELRPDDFEFLLAHTEGGMNIGAGIGWIRGQLDHREKEIQIKNETIKRLLGYLDNLRGERYPNQKEVDEFTEKRKLERESKPETTQRHRVKKE